MPDSGIAVLPDLGERRGDYLSQERGYPSGPAPDKLPPLPPSWPTKPSGGLDPRRIETVEELDALRDDTVILDVEHGAWQKRALFNGHEPWWGTGSEIEVASTFIALPAVVLWEPA